MNLVPTQDHDTPDTNRSHFLEETSRDARTAMSVIFGYSEMLAEELKSSNPHVLDDIERIREAGTLMVDLIHTLEERVEHEGQLASVDELTGVHNRRFLFTQGKLALKQARATGQPLAVVMMDIDHFKAVNDTYGHHVGDQVLVAIAGRCRQVLRDVDHFGRIGGEEFVAVLPDTHAEAAVDLVAHRLRRTIEATPVNTDGGRVQVTMSLGVATLDADTTNFDSLMDRADQALYEAKRSGRNRVVLYNRHPLASVG